MIQRIQTLYLLVAGMLLVLFAYFAAQWIGAQTLTQPWMGALPPVSAGLAAVVSFVSVVLYKDRAKQKKVIQVAQLLTLVTVAIVAAGLFLTLEGAFGAGGYLVVLAPVVAYAMLRLAQRGVNADIAKVRSMDRLR